MIRPPELPDEVANKAAHAQALSVQRASTFPLALRQFAVISVFLSLAGDTPRGVQTAHWTSNQTEPVLHLKLSACLHRAISVCPFDLLSFVVIHDHHPSRAKTRSRKGLDKGRDGG